MKYYTASCGTFIGIKKDKTFIFNSKYLHGQYNDTMIVDELGVTIPKSSFYYDVVEPSDIAVKDYPDDGNY